MPTAVIHALPRVVIDHVDACNNHDLNGLMATFAADAMVNDAGRAFTDRAAIQAWVEMEIVTPKVTMDVIDATVRNDNVTVRARIDGEYDKTGLPDPLILTYHFNLADGEIAQLIITLNKPDR
jgi:hypothetical protein